MSKQYIVDTSALINNPYLYRDFPNSKIIIPIAVLNELDKLKKGVGDVSRNARVCIRWLDEISNQGDISKGILLDNETILKIDATYIDLTSSEYSSWGDPTYGDTQILACLYNNWMDNNDTCLISNDINLRIKAKARSINAISHDKNSSLATDLYSGMQTIINEEAGSDLLVANFINPIDYDLVLNPNECVCFTNENGDEIALARKVGSNNLKLIKKAYPWGISPRNTEQSLAIDLIMDKNIDLITLIGKAGTGKSLIALACALELVIAKREYEKLIIYKPLKAVGDELGFLPGTEAEKLQPWFQSTMDNFELLFGNKVNGDWKRDLELYQKKGRIELSALTYIRGRSIPKAIILVEECQNLTNEEVKVILTRSGDGTKVIFDGDREQIDTKNLDCINNGLTFAIEKFKGSEIAGHISLTKGERSRLATIASEIL